MEAHGGPCFVKALCDTCLNRPMGARAHVLRHTTTQASSASPVLDASLQPFGTASSVSKLSTTQARNRIFGRQARYAPMQSTIPNRFNVQNAKAA
jgi:hypothetical protein